MGSTASACRTKASSLALTAAPDSSESVNARLSLVRVVRTRRRSPVSSRHWFPPESLPVRVALPLPALLLLYLLRHWTMIRRRIDHPALNCPLRVFPSEHLRRADDCISRAGQLLARV